MAHPFFTVGHSTRTIPEFAALLQTAGVQLVVDVRTVPRSRTNPQYNQDALPDNLAPYQIGYEHIATLGGLRGKAKSQPSELNGFWQNQRFHNYADHALTPQFAEGLRHIVELGRERRLAIMCSEAVWWRCHRRIISDYLLSRGETVFHLMGEGRVEPAKLTEGAVVRDDGSIVYPALSGRNGD